MEGGPHTQSSTHNCDGDALCAWGQALNYVYEPKVGSKKKVVRIFFSQKFYKDVTMKNVDDFCYENILAQLYCTVLSVL